MRSVFGRRFVSVASLVATLSVFSVFTESAAAQAFSFGHLVFGKPSCVSRDLLQSEEITCVFRGPNNELSSIQLNPRTGASSGFNILATSIVGNPSCVSGAANSIMCAVRGLDNKLYAIIFDSLTLASTGLRRIPQLQGIADSLAGDPSCVLIGPLFSTNPTVPPPTAICGVRDLANNFRVAQFSGTAQDIDASSIERPLEADEVVVGDPSCALAGTSAVICAMRAPESSLAVIALVGSVPVLREFLHLNGPPPLGFVVGDPSCASTSVGSLILAARTLTVTSSPLVTCGVRGTDNALSLIRFAILNGQIRASLVQQGLPMYLRLGGELTGNPSCASMPSEVVTCGVRGTDGALYLIDVDMVTSQTTGTYDRLTGVVGFARGLLATDPTCVAFGDAAAGYVACGILNLNNALNTVASARTGMF